MDLIGGISLIQFSFFFPILDDTKSVKLLLIKMSSSFIFYLQDRKLAISLIIQLTPLEE